MTTPHNIFYDTTGIEISPAIDRALKLIIKQSQADILDEVLAKPLCYTNDSKELAVLTSDVRKVAEDNKLELYHA